MVSRKKTVFFGFALLFVLSGCIGQQTAEEGGTDIAQEQVSDSVGGQENGTIQGEQISGSSETVPGEIMEEGDSSERVKCSRSFSPRFGAEPYYSGPLFDAHFHMPVPIDYSELVEEHGEMTDPILGKDVTLDEIMCWFDKENIRGAIGFYITSEDFLEESLETARTIKEKSSDRIILFLMPTEFETGRLDGIQESNPGLFKGYGEIAFYTQQLSNSTPSDKKFLDLYDVAGKHGLIVMMHPDQNQENEIEEALQNNPEVNFILHGWEISDSIDGLMEKYPNLYFSIDSAVLFPMMGLFMSGPKEKFVSRFEQNFDSMLNEQLSKWKGKIKKHPDRFVWGTDRGVKWHFDEEISILFEEFARAFIARIDPVVQEKFAYKNAEKLLQKR